MTQPWLSVLMPIYNGATTLAATLDSLLEQSEGIAVIAVLQSSEDDSLSILNAYEDRLNLRVIEARDTKNWMQNTNIALAEAQTQHVTMLHQDDLWKRGRAEALKRLIAARPEARLWVHAAEYIDATGKVVGRFAPPFGSKPSRLSSTEALKHLLVQNTIALPAAVFLRDDALSGGGLDESLWYTADWDLWLKLSKLGPVAWLPDNLAAFRIHADSQTIMGSADTDGFRNQLTIPVNRHISALEDKEARIVRRMARLSNELNACLAGAYHGRRSGLFVVGLKIIGLGPFGWRRFFRDTNIVGRVWPRLKMQRRVAH